MQQRRRKVDQVPRTGNISIVLPAIHPPFWTPPPAFVNPHAPTPMKMIEPESSLADKSAPPRPTGPVSSLADKPAPPRPTGPVSSLADKSAPPRPAEPLSNKPVMTEPNRKPYAYGYSSERQVRGIRTLLTEEVASICPFAESLNAERESSSPKLIIPVTLPEDVPIEEATSTNDSVTFVKPEPDVEKLESINDNLGIVPSMATTSDAPILFPTIAPAVRQEAVVPAELMTSIIEAQVPDIKSDGQTLWPELTIADINTTFNVVGGFKTGIRLKIVDDRYLAEDGSYLSSVYRYAGGQSRERNLSFVGHLFNETKRHTVKLLAEIRRGIDVDTKISELDTMIGKMMVFIHNFDMIREPYQSDTGTYAKFGVILDSFSTFRRSFFRDMVLTK